MSPLRISPQRMQAPTTHTNLLAALGRGGALQRGAQGAQELGEHAHVAIEVQPYQRKRVQRVRAERGARLVLAQLRGQTSEQGVAHGREGGHVLHADGGRPRQELARGRRQPALERRREQRQLLVALPGGVRKGVQQGLRVQAQPAQPKLAGRRAVALRLCRGDMRTCA